MAADLKDVYIIRGNPDVMAGNRDKYDRFYNDVADVVRRRGLSVGLDDGLEHTVPPGGRVWIGHSRGADRLRFAPKGVSTLRLDDYEETRPQQEAAWDRLFAEHKVKTVAEIPVHLRPEPGPEHYTLNDSARTAIETLLAKQRRADVTTRLRQLLSR